MTHPFRLLLFAAILSVSLLIDASDVIPLAYNKEDTSTGYPSIALPPIEKMPAITTLPDPLALADSSRRVTDIAGWERRRSEILQQLRHYELGAKPYVARDSVEAEIVNDTLIVNVHEKGKILTLKAAIVYPEGDGKFPAVIGIGFPTGSLPSELFIDRGVAGIAFDFTQVMSHTQTRGNEPINLLYPEHVEMGAYSAWPWGISRIIDGLEITNDRSRIDTSRIGVTGCSFAGKMALFAGATDERITLTIAQEPGGGGVASWRVSETLGDVETLGRTNYAWFKESMRQFSDSNVSKLPIDHHEVAALIAPRALLILGNPDYEWLADESSYVASVATREVWKTFGIADRMGYSIEANHMHCVLPKSQYDDVRAFIDRFLLGIDSVSTGNVLRAPMFNDVDTDKWMPWRQSAGSSRAAVAEEASSIP